MLPGTYARHDRTCMGLPQLNSRIPPNAWKPQRKELSKSVPKTIPTCFRLRWTSLLISWISNYVCTVLTLICLSVFRFENESCATIDIPVLPVVGMLGKIPCDFLIVLTFFAKVLTALTNYYIVVTVFYHLLTLSPHLLLFRPTFTVLEEIISYHAAGICPCSAARPGKIH